MRARRFRWLNAAAGAFLAACSSASSVPNTALGPVARSVAGAQVYQPLAVGDSWKYICNGEFTILDRVVRKVQLGGKNVFALSLQIPSSPTKSVHVIQLLSNDAHGNTWIYGYLIKNSIHKVKPTKIVAQSPVKGQHYNYPGDKGGTISRIFKEFEFTNRTPLGIFWVAAYFESNATHNYGYSLGRGVMEQDHGPNYKYDCLIEKYTVNS